jgi:hypothetical protein
MFWKPLLIIAPVGLLLGTIGGQMARPVIVQRAGDNTVEAMFQSRAERYGTSGQYSAQLDGSAYQGGYSYAPDFAEATPADWTAPDYYHYPDIPLPTLAELDARQAELLADPEVQFATQPPAPPTQLAAQDEPAPATAQVALGPEPRTEDGALPAIW